MEKAAAVFRGTVIDSVPLMRTDMLARRYVTRFRVKEYWKGDAGEILTLHDAQFSPILDCDRPSFKPGKEYLVYARTVSRPAISRIAARSMLWPRCSQGCNTLLISSNLRSFLVKCAVRGPGFDPTAAWSLEGYGFDSSRDDAAGRGVPDAE
jgi:hypothetical protein